MYSDYTCWKNMVVYEKNILCDYETRSGELLNSLGIVLLLHECRFLKSYFSER